MISPRRLELNNTQEEEDARNRIFEFYHEQTVTSVALNLFTQPRHAPACAPPLTDLIETGGRYRVSSHVSDVRVDLWGWVPPIRLHGQLYLKRPIHDEKNVM